MAEQTVIYINYFLYYLLFNVLITLFFVKEVKQFIANETKNLPKSEIKTHTSIVTLVMVIAGFIFIGQSIIQKFMKRGKTK